MKRIVGLLLSLLLLLAACSGGEDTMEQALRLRSDLQASGCAFDAVITADYGDVTYTFTLSCQTDKDGNLTFSVTDPASIAGITGKIDSGAGTLTFDDAALSFAMLADGQLTPVSAPWVVVGALRGGYIIASGADGEHTRLTVNDTYAEDALTVDAWLTAEGTPVFAEIEWDNRRILSMEIKNFIIR